VSRSQRETINRTFGVTVVRTARLQQIVTESSTLPDQKLRKSAWYLKYQRIWVTTLALDRKVFSTSMTVDCHEMQAYTLVETFSSGRPQGTAVRSDSGQKMAVRDQASDVSLLHSVSPYSSAK